MNPSNPLASFPPSHPFPRSDHDLVLHVGVAHGETERLVAECVKERKQTDSRNLTLLVDLDNECRICKMDFERHMLASPQVRTDGTEGTVFEASQSGNSIQGHFLDKDSVGETCSSLFSVCQEGLYSTKPSRSVIQFHPSLPLFFSSPQKRDHLMTHARDWLAKHAIFHPLPAEGQYQCAECGLPQRNRAAYLQHLGIRHLWLDPFYLGKLEPRPEPARAESAAQQGQQTGMLSFPYDKSEKRRKRTERASCPICKEDQEAAEVDMHMVSLNNKQMLFFNFSVRSALF